MEREDAKRILFLLETSYPTTYKTMTSEEKINQINLYQEMFSDYPLDIVVVALKNYIKTNKYPPTIAGLVEQIELILGTAEENTAEDMWNLVLNACKNSNYHSKDEYEKLPEACKRWLGSPTVLQEFAMMDFTTLTTVTRGQFLKTIGTIQKSVVAREALSDEMKYTVVRFVKGAGDEVETRRLEVHEPCCEETD